MRRLKGGFTCRDRSSLLAPERALRTRQDYRRAAKWLELEAQRGYDSAWRSRIYAGNLRWCAELAGLFGEGTFQELLARSGSRHPYPKGLPETEAEWKAGVSPDATAPPPTGSVCGRRYWTAFARCVSGAQTRTACRKMGQSARRSTSPWVPIAECGELEEGEHHPRSHAGADSRAGGGVMDRCTQCRAPAGETVLCGKLTGRSVYVPFDGRVFDARTGEQCGDMSGYDYDWITGVRSVTIRLGESGLCQRCEETGRRRERKGRQGRLFE